MCGIAGILTAPHARIPDRALDLITDSLTHRGPDARGTFSDQSAGIHLGHRRLSIVDLSASGAQPMRSRRYVIALNGEIYNHRQLRNELEREARISWSGTSDTEVLLHLIERHGIDASLARIEGMYAFALWDCIEHELVLVRDRFGEKPLFIAQTDGAIVFGSELRAIMAYPGFDAATDDDAISLFLQLSYTPETRTVFRGVRKLQAGHVAKLRPGDRDFTSGPYWQAKHSALDARVRAMTDNTCAKDTLVQIEERMREVVARQMVADVPVGAFLSGGIDSSLIVALMQQSASTPVKTFTIGFDEAAYDESNHARAVAEHLGTDHTEVILSSQDALAVIDDLPEIYSEPFADSSQIPTYLVSRIAREQVTVSLSGDGGDELFGGYNRHSFAEQLERKGKFVPRALRPALGQLPRFLAASRQQKLLASLQRLTGGDKISIMAERLGKLGTALQAETDLQFYASLLRRDEGVIGGDDLVLALTPLHDELANRGHSLAEQIMLLDTLTYLPGDILTKVDRAAMAVSLETRVPFLDHKLFELAWSLPIEERIKHGQTKYVLRQMLGRRVPEELFNRPKAGFGVPIEYWLRGPLKEWMTDYVSSFCTAFPQYAQGTRQMLSAYLKGENHAHHYLWNVAMLQSWRARFCANIHAERSGLLCMEHTAST